MDKSSIEQKIKDRLLSHEESIDNDSLFQALGIEEKPKKRKYLWILFMFLGVGIIGSGVYFSTNQSSITDLFSENSTPKIDNFKEDTKENFESQKVISNTSELVQNEDNSNIVEGKNSTIEESTKEHSIKNVVDQSIQVESTNGAIDNKFQSNQSLKKGVQDVAFPSVIQLERTDYSSTKEFEEKSTKETKTIEKKIESEINKNNLITFNKDQIKDKGENLDSTLKPINHSQPLDNNIEKSFALNRLDYIRLETFFNEDPIFDVKGELAVIDESELPQFPPFVSKESKWSLNPYVSYDKFQHRMMTTNPAFTEYLEVRSSHEKPLESIGAGLLVQYSINDHLYAGIGIEFAQYNTQFNYSEFLYADTGDSTMIARINYLGDTTMISGSMATDTEIERQWKTYNEWRLINIPVVLGYEYQFGKLGVFGEIGMQFGVYSNFSGKLYDSKFAIQDNPTNYYNKLNISAEIGLGMSYALTSKTSLFGKVRYRNYLKDISSIENPLQESLAQAGLVVGCRYKL